jgi:hypothetical protein
MEILGIVVLAWLLSMAANFTINALKKKDSYHRQLLTLGVANERVAFFFALSAAVLFTVAGLYFGRSTVIELYEVFERLVHG